MENKILLIDDEAHKGWKTVLKHLFFENHNLDAATSINEAEELLEKNFYELIFLDLRFGENDHLTNELFEFAGYNLLKKLKSDFLSKNFAIPVVLFTASNKAWYINEMLDAGCDDYYIKEHPDTAYDENFTRNNTKRLKSSIIDLLGTGTRRNEIWQIANSIIKNIECTVPNKNIQQRIKEKLRIGYGLLFNKTSSFEKVNLLYNNEVLTFIVFWSILEELSHSHYGRNETFDKSWVLQHSKNKIQYFDIENKLISGFSTINDEFNSFTEITNDKNSHQVKLSRQISAILRYDLKWSYSDIRLKFLDKLNRYRNKIDFIHSDTKTINTVNITKDYDSNEAFDKCIQVLKFLELFSNEKNFK